jgi:hypothetical protein
MLSFPAFGAIICSVLAIALALSIFRMASRLCSKFVFFFTTGLKIWSSGTVCCFLYAGGLFSLYDCRIYSLCFYSRLYHYVIVMSEEVEECEIDLYKEFGVEKSASFV